MQLGYILQHIHNNPPDIKLAKSGGKNIAESKDHNEIISDEVINIVYAISVQCPYLKRKEVKRFARIIHSESQKYGYDWELIMAIMKAESAFDVKAVSRKGAMGLMQVMPETAEWLATEMDVKYDGNRSLYNPEYNIKLGVHYFDMMQKRFGDVEKAVTAYRIGPNRLKQNLDQGIDPGSAYLQEVMSYYAELKETDS